MTTRTDTDMATALDGALYVVNRLLTLLTVATNLSPAAKVKAWSMVIEAWSPLLFNLMMVAYWFPPSTWTWSPGAKAAKAANGTLVPLEDPVEDDPESDPLEEDEESGVGVPLTGTLMVTFPGLGQLFCLLICRDIKTSPTTTFPAMVVSGWYK